MSDRYPPYPVASAEGGPVPTSVQPWERAFARLRECREFAGIPDSEVLSPAVAKLLVFVCDESRALTKAAAQSENWVRDEIRDVMKEVCDQEEEVTCAVETMRGRVEELERKVEQLVGAVTRLNMGVQ